MPSSTPISLNVGGTKFITSASTLISNSVYFESLLSGNWIESNDSSEELFLDHDPTPFGILLAFMRKGMINVADIDTDVMMLAEFLGIEKLLTAIKVRWYCNIGRGPVLTSESETAAAFDQQYGGIRSAISQGLFPTFLKQDDINAEKDLAVVDAYQQGDSGDEPDGMCYSFSEIITNSRLHCDSLVGALNGLFDKGYTRREASLDRHYDELTDAVVFSRRKHSTISLEDSATQIFIPTNAEIQQQREATSVKQFVLVCQDDPISTDEILIPAAIGEGQDLVSPFATRRHNEDLWLHRHQFTTREEELEKLFDSYFKLLRQRTYLCKIYSRMIPRETPQQNEMNE